MIDLLNVDCMEYMASLPDKAFDLAIVDPPYGINAPDMQMGSHPNRSRNDGYGSGPAISTINRLQRLNGGGGKLKNRILNTSKIEWDVKRPSKEYFDQLFRVSVNQIIWGGNYFDLPPTRGIAVWNKLQPWENFSQCELAWTSFDYPAKLKSLSNTGGNNIEIKIHPTQKPVAHYKWLLKNYAKQGDKILDTHGGSMSSAIACHQMGFDLTLCEIDKDYYDAGVKRFNEAKKQQSLFEYRA